ncbi:hypothetical protein [Arthrobacter sp.]|uniref:hypothetical protein n=1 Tax=Arthrobacter sp. TaxID=1667 RepID=UPI0028114AEF|nr:hypothetical protein [Arthrobacter sp.]
MPHQNPSHRLRALDVRTKAERSLCGYREQRHVCTDFDVEALLAVFFGRGRAGAELCLQNGCHTAGVLDDLAEDGLLGISGWLHAATCSGPWSVSRATIPSLAAILLASWPGVRRFP